MAWTTTLSAREIIEAVIEHTTWTVNNSRDIVLAQGFSADVKIRSEDR